MSLTGDGQNVNVNGNLVLPGPTTKIRTPLIQFSDNTTLVSANGIWSSGTGGLSYSGNVYATNFSGNASNLSNLTGAAAGTYGSGSSIPTVTVDASGRITSVSATTINTVSTGTSGQLAYYTSSSALGGDVGLGYVSGTQTLSVGGSLRVGGDIFVSGNTYVGNNVVFNDAIVAIGNSYPNGTTMGLLMQRPAGNVMMGYLSTEGGSAYTNALVFGYTFSGASGSLLTPDLSNTLNVQVLGSVSSTTGFYGNVLGTNTVSASTLYGAHAGSNTINASTVSATTFYGAVSALANTVSGANLYGNLLGSNTVSAATFYGAVSGSNTISTTAGIFGANLSGNLLGSNTVSASGFFGPISGSNTVAASTISGTTLYGALAGSNTINASTVSATTFYGAVSALANTVSGANLYGNLLGSNTVSASGFFGVVSGSNAMTASNITVSGNVSVGNATVSTSTLTVGSNLFVVDAGSNVLVVSGNVSASRFTGNGSTLTGLTGATPGLYGNATTVSQITVDASGRITGISNVSITSSSNLAQVVDNGNVTANTVLFTNATTSLVASGNVVVQGQSNLIGNTFASNISVYSISFGGTSDGYVRSISLQDTTDISNSTTRYITAAGLSTTTYNPTFLTSVSALGTWGGTPTPALGGASLGAFSATIGASITNFTPSGGLVAGTYTIYAISNGSWTVAASMAGSVSNLASTLSLSTGNRVLITITYDGTVYYVNWVKYS